MASTKTTLRATRITHPFAGGRSTKTITTRHRALVWECMLGTVYAQNRRGQIRYFDYDWDAARAFAGVDDATDLRTCRCPRAMRVGHGRTLDCDVTLPKGKLILWGIDA